MRDETLTIRQFQTHDQVAARELVLAGLIDAWGHPDVEQEPRPGRYRRQLRPGHFPRRVPGTQLVGTGAIVQESEGVCRIVCWVVVLLVGTWAATRES